MGWLTHEINDPRTRARIEQALGAGGNAKSTIQEPPVLSGGHAARPSLPESDLHDYILDWWHEKGWLAIHSRMDQRTTTAKGVSDFILVCPRTVLFVECKRPGKKPTPEQLAFLAHVQKMGWPNAVVTSREEFHQFIEPLI